jgi:cell division protein FtsB
MPPARSAAVRHRSRAARAAPVRRPKPRRVILAEPWRRVRWDRLGRVSLLVVLTIVGALYVEHILSYLSTRQQAERQLAIVQALVRQNHQLEAEQRALRDPATIVAQARALGMVKAGERSYAVTGLPDH